MTANHPRPPYPGPFRFTFLAPRYWATWLGISILWLLYLLPDGARLALGAWLGDKMYLRNKKRVAIIETNLRLCFPEQPVEKRTEIARQFFRHFVQCHLDYGLLWWGSERALKRRLTVEGEESLTPHLATGRPIILLSAHHTAVDFAGIALNRQHPKMLSLFKHLRNPLMDWMVARGRVRSGGLVFARGDDFLPWVRLVRNGYMFYYMPDEDLGPEQSVFAPFFGVPAATLTALPRLTRLCKAVVVPCMAYHRDGRYVARLFPALENYPSGDEIADATAMNTALETMLRVSPEQYIWSLRIFQTRPAGERCPYDMKRVRGYQAQTG